MSKRLGKQERVSLEQCEGDSQEDFQHEMEKKNRDVITIKITLKSYQNIVGFFPTSDIKTLCSFDGKNLGETTWKPVTDDEYLHIGETFSFTIDSSSAKEIDKLISLPLLMIVSQATGSLDANLYDNLQINQDFSSSTQFRSLDSIINMYESFTDHKLSRSDFFDQYSKKSKRSKKTKTEKISKKTKDLSTYGSDSSYGEKRSLPYQSRLFQSEPTSEDQEDPVIYGMCTIDFLPLFQGQKSFSETLLIRPVRKYDDEKMISYKAHPKIMITVSTDGDLNFVGAEIMNITIESIFNIPSLVRPEVDYKINVILPKVVTRKVPISFTNSHYTSKTVADLWKCWPNMPKIGLNANTTKYTSNANNDELLNKIGEDVGPYLKKKCPRLLFNMIKRNLLLEDGWREFADYIRTRRKILLEISMNQRGHRKSNSNLRPEKETSLPSLKLNNETVKKTKLSFSHFMAVVDVSPLLDPGVLKVRVATPLSSYSSDEALKYYSQEEVLNTTIRKMFPSRENLNKLKDKTNKMKDKDSEKSEKSSMKTKDKEHGEKDLKAFLPSKPEAEPKPEPVVPIFNEQGKPCFIIVEIELSKPITPKRDIEDLRDKMYELLHNKPQPSPKVVLCDCLAKSYYRELLENIMQDIKDKFQRFSTEYPNYNILSDRTSNFMNFLQSIGVYQAYTSAITKATTLLVTNELKFGETNKNGKGYKQFIGEVFVHLMSEMNDTLNKLVCHGPEPAHEEILSDKYFLYAKEALEMGDTNLANRYLLERICGNKENPDCWFDYGVYFLEMGNADRAFECVLEALRKNPKHQSSLMALGALMDNKGQKDEAEMCFLNLMVSAPKWLEGWGVLYIFYWKHDCYEGMDVALEMANKYIDAVGKFSAASEDLAWTSNICPNTVFFRTAMVLLKMRLYDWAEIALSEELSKNCGSVHYLLAAICYYEGLYSHALEHIDESKKHFGWNYAVASLSGHCLLALNRMEKAKAEYDHAMGEFQRPNDIHLVHLNLAKILESCGQDQEARKFALLACKYNPTPYTWLRAGQFYLQENDSLSAEECFSEGNVRDPRHAELWGNLCLVNFKLDRLHEAELCYQQAMLNRLPNCDLRKTIEELRNCNDDN